MTKASSSHDCDDTIDQKVALSLLLIHMAEVDQRIRPEEIVNLKQLLGKRFGLDDFQVQVLADTVGQNMLQAGEIEKTVALVSRSDLKRAATALWQMAFCDHELHESEERLGWKLCDLLGLRRAEALECELLAARQYAT